MSALPPAGSFEKEFGYVERNCLEPRHELRRASDLILPAENSSDINYLIVRDIGIKSIVNEIELGKITGGLKLSNKDKLSRGFLLLSQGRVYGVIYTDMTDTFPKPAAEAIYDVIGQLRNENTSLMMFPLSEEVVVPLAALFVGYPVERNDDFSALDYLDYVLNWLNQEKGTASLAISISGRYPATTLAFVSKGAFSGFFNVDDVAFNTDADSLRTSLKSAPKAALEVSILPPQFYNSRASYGFTLSALL